MAEKDANKDGHPKGLTRRVFINQGLAAAGGAAILTNAASWPAWADSSDFEGTFSRMGRTVYDKEADETWMSFLEVELAAREINTKWGPTRVTDSKDRVMVRRSGKETVDVSDGQPDAKLAPRIDARNEKVCVAWCACHPETKAWRVFANYSKDGRSWTGPMTVAGEKGHVRREFESLGYLDADKTSGAESGPALHPSVAIDPQTGHVFVAYEDWSDGSIRLTEYDGTSWSKHLKISEGGRNYRPKVIVTAKDGKHKGAAAVTWDSYRDKQYDIYLRLVHKGGSPGPELRVTKCARWDSCADLIEDKDGNLWTAWVRASNEISEMNAMRNIHARFYDGKDFYDPHQPRVLFDETEFNTASAVGMGPDDRVSAKEALVENSNSETGDGRITWYSVNWFPILGVDRRNRVYVFYRAGDPMIPPLYSHLDYRVYEGDRWSAPKRIKLKRGANILHTMWDLSVTVADRRIKGLWGQGYMNLGKTFWTLEETETVRLRDIDGPLFHPEGKKSNETMYKGWPLRETFRPSRTMKINGEEHTLVFGDTHTHSWTSDGADPADYYYHFARDYARLDFFALSDHDFLISGTPGIEAYISFLPRYFSGPDFICFQAYEFTSSARGHRVVVFESDHRPTFPLGVFNTQRMDQVNTTGNLYNFLHKFCVAPDSRVLVTSHNMFKLGNDFSQYDPSLEPLYDVTSLHLAAEKTVKEYVEAGVIEKQATAGMSALMKVSAIASGTAGKMKPEHGWYFCWKQILDAGMPLGAYGASDTHAANGTGWITAGIWARDKSRKAIFDAMFQRRSFAVDNGLRTFDIWSTYPGNELQSDMPVLRMDIRFWLDDHFMGENSVIHSPPTARALVAGEDASDPVSKIVFVKDGKEVHTARKSEAEWKDEDWKAGRHYYYVRVEFQSGNQGFSSPVFVDY